FSVTKVLASFLRQRENECTAGHVCGNPDEDVVAAFAVVACRPRRTDAKFSINLRGLNVCGIELWGNDSSEAADLEGVNLDGACLRNADLEFANLGTASLVGANLEGARLDRANLSVANLAGANFNGASLEQASLYAADLRDAVGLGMNMLARAKFDATTKLPSNLSVDE
ncbi:pentapeptide repeat-containing protein, partial [Streptomyces sp. 2MCAF27]